jgi:hypothetical protein
MAGTTQISSDTAQFQPELTSAAKAAEQDLWIFRDGKRSVHGPGLVDDLRRRIVRSGDASALLDALIQAGELEAALADSGSESTDIAAEATNRLAAAAIGTGPREIADAAQLLQHIRIPAVLSIAPPEGFTYYALHPTDFAHSARKLPAEAQHYAIVGIRSIGTTLSAVVLAALLDQDKRTSRITVRPTGHPYSRTTRFRAEQLRWIDENRGAQFLVVDEGPGRSGSTFLSVAEALLQAGVPRQAITMLGSRQPDLASLCADNAAARWQEFRFVATRPSVNRRFEGCTYIGGGNWREVLRLPENTWPESWTQMERLKFLSPDRQTLYKFEGMGPIGAEVRQRASALADADFGPKFADAEGGFLAYQFLQGPHAQARKINSAMLDRIAEYLAFRHAEFSIDSSAEKSQLREMLEFNIVQEFGIEINLPEDAFGTSRPVISDGRMQPYEWISSESGHMVKTDGVDHGDNHFFPGPCDIAWDLAGTAVEWQLENDASQYLAAQFRSRSGKDISAKLDVYKLAYCVFRLGSCKMAVSTVKGSPEEERLKARYGRYRSMAEALLLAITSPAKAA